MTKLADFLSTKKIDHRRLLAASHQLEALSPSDRAIRFAKIRTKKNEASDAQKELAKSKGTSGKPVTTPLLNRALEGKSIPGAGKTRILRAVNRVLEHKKQSAAQLKDLF